MAIRRPATGERGAVIAEFALILPIFMMLMLGIFTGGLAYNRKLAMTNGSREAARFGATVPVVATGMTAWLDSVAAVAVSSAEGEMDSGVSGRSICVAYVYPAGVTATDKTASRRQTASGTTYGTTPCYSDGQPNSVRRVQVVLERTSELQALLVTRNLTLRSRSVVRFEASEL
jgi:Flp pilus assembly protein TadG